jgi:hypothetical protein
MTYQMIKPKALEWFKEECRQGRPPDHLPEGAFDAMPPELSPQIQPGQLDPSTARALDALSASTRAAIVNHLGRKRGTARDADLPDNNNGGASLAQKICGFLDGKVDPAVLQRVEEMLQAGGAADGVTPIKRAYEGGGLAAGYDPTNNNMTQDEPPPFSGRPNTGGSMLPMTAASRGGSDNERAMALHNSNRIAGEPPPPAYMNGMPVHDYNPRQPAMDSASIRAFAKRWPEVARIKVV